MQETFTLDGAAIPFAPGQTILQAALAAGAYVPHLCFHPEFKPHGSCKICSVESGGRIVAACTALAEPGQAVESATPEIDDLRRGLLQMLFVEGNHFCPGCEKSGDCVLQALAYKVEMLTPRYPHFYPARPLDASHPDVLLDFNRCILCELCVRASRDVDGKNVFAIAGRGMREHVIVDAPSGKLGDTDFAITDKAAHVCPVGAILVKGVGFSVPIGSRTFDAKPIDAQVEPRVAPAEDAQTGAHS